MGHKGKILFLCVDTTGRASVLDGMALSDKDANIPIPTYEGRWSEWRAENQSLQYSQLGHMTWSALKMPVFRDEKFLIVEYSQFLKHCFWRALTKF